MLTIIIIIGIKNNILTSNKIISCIIVNSILLISYICIQLIIKAFYISNILLICFISCECKTINIINFFKSFFLLCI